MKKTHITKAKDIKRQWHLIDLKGQILGRIATKIAVILQGKDKPYYTPALDCGDYVIATNLNDIKVTGKKETDKIYYWHTNYPGGLRQRTYAEMKAKNPKRILYLAVKNMLPKNKLQAPRLVRLKIFLDDKHPYQDKLK